MPEKKNDDIEFHVKSKARSAETGLPLDKKQVIDPGEGPIASKEFDPDETLNNAEREKEQSVAEAVRKILKK